MRKARWILPWGALSLILLSSSSMGVSRWGGGQIKDAELGFEAPIPSQAYGTRELVGGKLAVFLPAELTLDEDALPTSEITAEITEIGPVLSWFPHLMNLDQAEVRRLLLQASPAWMELPAKACIIGFTIEKSTATNAIFLWGKGKGIVIAGHNTPHVKQAIQEVWDGLMLREGACAWQ